MFFFCWFVFLFACLLVCFLVAAFLLFLECITRCCQTSKHSKTQKLKNVAEENQMTSPFCLRSSFIGTCLKIWRVFPQDKQCFAKRCVLGFVSHQKTLFFFASFFLVMF